MNEKRKPSTPPAKSAKAPADEGFRRRKTTLKVRRRPDANAWELVHPRCARERTEDLEEVRAMLAAGEDEIAVEELRWLLSGCSDFVAAHRLLGELALAAGDTKLARGHFGYAYELGMSAFPPSGPAGPVPYHLPANQDFFESAKGLAWCLHELGRRRAATSVVESILKLDATDPLGVRAWLNEWPGSTAGGEA